MNGLIHPFWSNSKIKDIKILKQIQNEKWISCQQIEIEKPSDLMT